ncbi:hypothetical protein D8B26_004842 [Coccidioides posadasii str. Silveira]|uniref:Uncharacterized protein n=2 Tax=Coccidioides posadasii TaxID=199306 RepID=E9D6E8_COCPS|nr:conserved hypothetical protein [Coccidioides posadasii str. Silveira]KMM68512.1 hypothetical protein CPAG_04839 [Coccidioides posadasii RMSCC 3488]QVM10180.1 hypothetical protein D8B26_004842 [Coccidioides posadasii str. Silveira]
MATWVKCCFERGRLGQRHRKGTRQLDERYGDMDISGPMDGGWNQLPSFPSEKRSTSVPVSRSGTRRQRQGVGHVQFRAHTGAQPFVCISESVYDTPARPSHEKPPDFVYKPASEAFFKDMAEIGRPKYSPPPSTITEKHRRQTSMRSASSLDPSSAGEIPCHPSYQRNIRTSSPHGSSCSGYHRSPPLHAQCSRANSPALSTRSNEITDEDVEKRVLTTIPLSTKKKQKKSRRAVTEELVPSTMELFG